jgi:hypothetical protein
MMFVETNCGRGNTDQGVIGVGGQSSPRNTRASAARSGGRFPAQACGMSRVVWAIVDFPSVCSSPFTVGILFRSLLFR